MADTSELGFLAELDGAELNIAHALGGGRTFDADQPRDLLVDEVADYVRSIARDFAEHLVDEVEAGLDDDDEEA